MSKYQDPDYLNALRFLTEDTRIETVGLCNFDTKHLIDVIEAGIKIYTNQVQVRRTYLWYRMTADLHSFLWSTLDLCLKWEAFV